MEILTDKRSDCKEILKLVSENKQGRDILSEKELFCFNLSTIQNRYISSYS